MPKTLDKMTVQLHPPPSLQPKEVDITFDPPMEDLREFRKRVLGWRDEAYRHFKVVSFNVRVAPRGAVEKKAAYDSSTGRRSSQRRM